MTPAAGSGWTPHDWLTLAGLLLGSGGLWRVLGKLERFLAKIGRIESTVADLARSHKQIARQHARLVDRVNDHEARLIQGGRLWPG